MDFFLRLLRPWKRLLVAPIWHRMFKTISSPKFQRWSSALEAFEPAFEHPDMAAARELVG